MQKITPYLWFDNQAEEAVKFYISLFKNSKITTVTYYGEGMPLPAGTVLTISFELAGQEFVALNGGPYYKFTEAISLFVDCEDQEEVDDLWTKFTAGGEESMCGWLKDKYGLSWQIVPKALGRMMSDPDPVKVQRMVQAMLQMKKLDVAGLQRAFDGQV